MVGIEFLILGLMALIYLMPAALLFIAAVLIKKRISGFSAILIAIGAVCLAVSGIQALGNFYIASTGEAADVAAFTLKWAYAVIILEFFGLISIALGLIGLSRRLSTSI